MTSSAISSSRAKTSSRWTRARIGLREQLQQGRQVLFLDRLLLAIGRAPGRAGRLRVRLGNQPHRERTGNTVSTVARQIRSSTRSWTARCSISAIFDARGRAACSCRIALAAALSGLGRVLVIAARRDVGLGIAILELE